MTTWTYADLRPRLRTGHVVLWRGDSLLARCIRLWSAYSHASLVVRLEEYEGLRQRVWLVEALAEGPCLRLLSQRLAGYAGSASVLLPPATDPQRLAVRQWALACAASGQGYDYGSLLRNILGRVSLDARRWFCSELVWQAYLMAGAAERKGHGAIAPRPGDLPGWLGGELLDLAPLPVDDGDEP